MRVGPLLDALETAPTVAALLVRMGGYAVGATGAGGRSDRAFLVSVELGRRDDADAASELTELAESAGLMVAGRVMGLAVF